MRTYPQLYSQRDPRWASQRLGTVDSSTIGQYGCILVCQAMKAGYYGHEIAPDALDDIFTNKEIYYNNQNTHTPPADLLADDGITKVFSDIVVTKTYDYSSSPADMALLQQLSSDDTTTVTIEVDFDHDPTDGIQTHFVELHSYDGNALKIYDPWYGTDDDFSLHYGTNPAQTILKYAVYKGNPVGVTVPVDSATFQKLVASSTANDAVCDELGLQHDAGKDAEISAIKQLKTDKANAQADAVIKQTTIENLNKQIPTLEGEISTLTNSVTDLTQKMNMAIDQANLNDNAKKLYDQCEIDLRNCRINAAEAEKTYNRIVAQLKNSSFKEASTGDLFGEWVKRVFRLK